MRVNEVIGVEFLICSCLYIRMKAYIPLCGTKNMLVSNFEERKKGGSARGNESESGSE